MQHAPVDRDLARADAEKAAEVDDGGAQHAAAVDDDVDDAAEILALDALHRLAQQRLRRIAVNDDRRRFRDASLWRRGRGFRALRRAARAPFWEHPPAASAPERRWRRRRSANRRASRAGKNFCECLRRSDRAHRGQLLAELDNMVSVRVIDEAAAAQATAGGLR